jgi:hypothetical protein
MKRFVRALPHVVLAGALLAIPALGAAQDQGGFGHVKFSVTCSARAQQDFQAAVAVLHSFWYPEAQRRFAAIAAREPDCAMAHWGVAMSLWHPLWQPPSLDDLAQGRAAVERARAAQARSARERAYVEAIGAFYATPGEHPVRAGAYLDAMRRVHEGHPQDLEAAVFYALALLAAAPPQDRSYAMQRDAAALLETLYAAHPDHPGVAHYLIHALDYPTLARRALPAAQRYAAIAPGVAHAQHMPSHIFSQLGMWPESLASNRASARASRQHASLFDLAHALEWQAYAALQSCRPLEARQVLEELGSYAGTSDNFAAEYSINAVAARYTLEREDWSGAAALDLPPAKFPYAASTAAYARALGAANTGDLDRAARAVDDLARLAKGPANRWMHDVEVQHLAAAGWLAHVRGDGATARARLREAAQLEERTYMPGPGPAPVLPARELEADLLLALGDAPGALAAYQGTLAQFAGRLRSLRGAERAAKAAGDAGVAERYAAQANAQCAAPEMAVVLDAGPLPVSAPPPGAAHAH